MLPAPPCPGARRSTPTTLEDPMAAKKKAAKKATKKKATKKK